MSAKKLLKKVVVTDQAGATLNGLHFRKVVDASDDGGKDHLIIDTIELEDGRIAFPLNGMWVDEDDHRSVFHLASPAA